MSENKVGVEFYIAGASNVARDVQKINSTLSGVGKAATLGGVVKAGLAFMGIRTSLRAIGREARQFLADTAMRSPEAVAGLSKLNTQYGTLKATLQEWLIPLTNDFVRGLNRIAAAAGAAAAGVDSIIRAPTLSMESLDLAMQEYRQVTGDARAFTQASDEFGYGSAGRQMPAFPDKWAEIQRSYQQGVAGREPAEVVTEAQRTARKQIEEMNAALDRQIYIQAELSAGRTHAADLMQYSIVLEQAYGDKIEEQMRLYAEYEDRLTAVDQIKRDMAVDQYIQGMEQEVEYLRLVVEGREQEAEALRIVNDLKKQGIELTPQEKQQVEALVAEQSALSKEIDRQQDSARRWGRVMQQSIDGVADALAGAIVYSEDLEENFKNLALSLAFDWTRQSISSGIGALLHVGTMHAGGVVGRDSGPPRGVDPIVFAGAPRLHGGLQTDEFPAILQRGEEVLSRDAVRSGRSSPNVSVNVVNNGTAKNARATEPEWNGREWVIGVILDDYDKGGKTRSLIRGRR